MASGVELVDRTSYPDGILNPCRVQAEGGHTLLAPRIETFRGRRLGLIDNGKANAGLLLGELAVLICGRWEVPSVYTLVKADAGLPANAEQSAELAAHCDVVLAAIGDCGSCSAATLADSIVMERLGVPAVSICSEAFCLSADAMAKAYASPGFRYATVPHPVATLGLAEVKSRSAGVLPLAMDILGVEAP